MNTKPRTINSIKGEIHNLLAVLRFLPSSCPEIYTSDLLDLFQKLLVCSDVDSVDYWSPFLKIIQGPDTSSSIKGVALSSIHKFLLYGFLSPTSAYTLNKIVNGVVQCIIESCSNSDEVVLMKLLHVFLECLRAPASVFLTDSSVWSIAKRCFDVYERDRVSELLKKTAQNTLLQIFLIVFSRVHIVCESVENEGYGVVCLKKILLHLAHLVGYSDKNDINLKEKRCLGLFLLNTALETAGENIGLHSELISVIQDEVCKSLLLNSATDDLFILSLTLRVVFNLFQSVKQHLKVQQEVFFNSIHLKIAAAYEESQDQTIYQRSELALESIVDFCREPSLMLELYTNYDCDVEFANLFERLAKFLCKHAFPLHSQINRLNELCLEGLLAIISSISMRCDKNLQPSESLVQDFREKKTLKEIFLKSAEIFNSDQKEFIPKLQELNYLPKDCDELAVAKFLKENPAIDHEKLGEYLGKNSEYNIKKFLSLFDYKNLRIDQAMRDIFKSCKIPGEAQVIDRVISMFAHAYYSESEIIKDETAAYVLAFSLILLNTDLNTASVKTKMPFESYTRNLKGVNSGEDFPETFLKALYDSIKADPIEAKEVVRSIEQNDIADMGNKWGKVLLRCKNTGGYWMLNELLRQPAGENEKVMFEILWESGLLGTLTSAIECVESPRAAISLKELFVECSKVSAYYNMKDFIHKIISILCQSFSKNAESVPVLFASPKSFYVLEAAVGSAIMAKDYLNNAWMHLINLLLRLHKLKLLPNQLIELDDFVDEDGNALPVATAQLDETFFQYFRNVSYSHSASVKSEEESVEETSGIWASFVKYLGVPSHNTKSNEEILQEMTFEIKEKILSSGLHLLFTTSKSLEIASLTAFLNCWVQKCRSELDEINLVLCIEIVTSSVLSNFARISENTWKNVLECLEALICNETHTWTSERALVNLIRITVLHHEDYSGLRDSLANVLVFMAKLPAKKFSKFGERLAAGLAILLSQGNAYFLYTSQNWENLLKLLQNFIIFERTIKIGFELFLTLIGHIEKNQEIEQVLFENLLDTVVVYFKSESPDPNYVLKSSEILLRLYKTVNKRYSAEKSSQFWKKIVGELGKLCQNMHHSVRVIAYSALQEAILGNSSLSTWANWKECFEKVLFPLVVEPFVITAETLKSISEEKGIIMRKEYEASREKATALVCQTVLNILPILSAAQDFQLFWLRLVKLLSQTLRIKEEISEKSYELLKNLLLIVKTENIISEDLWTETWSLVNLEELKAEINS